MNTVTVKILVFFLSVFILITVFSQVSLIFEDEYKTETAVTYSSAEKITFKGIYIRNEKVITYNGSGVLSYPNADGGRIAKNSVVAYVYDSEDTIYNNQMIEKLNQEIELLENAQSPGTTEAAQQEFMSGLISEEYQQIISLSARENYADLVNERDSFLSLLSIYQIVVKEEDNYNDRISELKSEVRTLENKHKDYTAAVYTEDPGYFVSYTDGYESQLNPDKTGSLTVEEINKIVSEDNSTIVRGDTAKVGKIIDGYKWKMTGLISSALTAVQPGSTVRLKFSSTPDTVEAVVDSVKPTEDGKQSIIVLSCDKLTYNLVQHRVERVEMVLNDYEGIKVPRDAIRFNSANEKGVYILLGQKISFRKVDVIYESKDYVLSKITSDSSFISMYDDIIVEGANVNELVAAAETTAEPTGGSDTAAESAGGSDTAADSGQSVTSALSETESDTEPESESETEHVSDTE